MQDIFFPPDNAGMVLLAAHWALFVGVIVLSAKYVFRRRRKKAEWRAKHPYRGPHLYWSMRVTRGLRVGGRIK
ncbi:MULTISPECIES: hypothetical protein [unclassified Caballeronia]|uniref:hypothetical protein n=1 Tax=unclassified Caballeronia TaxID=2646786 RepID=UPI0028544DDC|nr:MULTISPECIES: hypothetical protein [unclassified Caballeronia]MDR5750352.1 hypothetical protein [Caballeronia sp. LZ024]MDR5842616.1 hypothetical protein [Caballeronia sp. LZ031]